MKDTSKTVAIGLVLSLFIGLSVARAQFLDSLLQANTISIQISKDTFVGNDMEKLSALMKDVQFVSIAEEHEVVEVNMFCAAMFSFLSSEFGFRYAALEQGPIVCDALNSEFAMKNDPYTVENYAKRYRRAFHLSGDRELSFIQQILNSSSAPNALWGCNQEYGAEPALDMLRDMAIGKSRDLLDTLFAHAHRVEGNRKDNPPYMCCTPKPKAFYNIDKLDYGMNQERAKPYYTALLSSANQYDLFRNSTDKEPTRYENNQLREIYLKTQFKQYYLHALQSTHSLPKVMLKFGHWHIQQGLGPSGIHTLGSFVSDLAFMNGTKHLSLGVFLNNPEGEFRGYRNGSLREFMCTKLQSSSTYSLVCTEPLRKYAFSKRLKSEIPQELLDQFEKLIYQYDTLLYIKDAHLETWNVVYSEN